MQTKNKSIWQKNYMIKYEFKYNFLIRLMIYNINIYDLFN